LSSVLELNEKIMHRIFPQWKQYPINSLTPSIEEYDDTEEPIAIHMMFIGDDYMLQDFAREQYTDAQGKVMIETSLYIEPNEFKVGKDLVLRFEFFYPTGNPVLETVIVGDMPDMQKYFIKSLEKIDKFYLWIADRKGKMVRVKRITWNYDGHKTILNQIMQEV